MTDLPERIATLREAHAWMDKMAPDHMKDAMDIIAELERRLAEAERDARRYEIVRKWNVPQFQAAYKFNISTGKPFDEIVDDYEPFDRALAAGGKEAGNG